MWSMYVSVHASSWYIRVILVSSWSLPHSTLYHQSTLSSCSCHTWLQTIAIIDRFFSTIILSTTMLFDLKVIVATLLLAAQVNACMILDAVRFANFVVSAQIHDNGVNTCNFPNSATTGQDGHYWFTCRSGHAAFLTSDMAILAYSANGDYRFSTDITSTQYECDPLTGGCGTSTRYRTTGFC